MLQAVILMNVVYVLVIIPVVLTVQAFQMEQIGKVTVDVLPQITRVMSVMIVMG